MDHFVGTTDLGYQGCYSLSAQNMCIQCVYIYYIYIYIYI